MGRHVEGKARAGSQKWLQALVNNHTELLNTYIAPKLRPQPSSIEWLSPLRSDEYAEYNDNDFIKLIDVTLDERSLSQFWPEGGPHWDALATTDNGQILLAEAKSHILELRSHLGATSHVSINHILASLSETKRFMRADSRADWTTPFYQSANRLAHLYLLSDLNGVNAYLINIYFLNDHDMQQSTTIAPKSIQEWESAILTEKIALGLSSRHRLHNRIINTFIDVNRINGKQQ